MLLYILKTNFKKTRCFLLVKDESLDVNGNLYKSIFARLHANDDDEDEDDDDEDDNENKKIDRIFRTFR